MWMLWFVLAPLIVLQAAWLIMKKRYSDTVVFAAVSLTGFALWTGIVRGRPIILTIVLGRIFEPVVGWLFRS